MRYQTRMFSLWPDASHSILSSLSAAQVAALVSALVMTVSLAMISFMGVRGTDGDGPDPDASDGGSCGGD
jgi:hypothetical protein